MPDTLTLRALNRATLSRQMLLAREEATPLATIERLAGMQAQQPKPPFIGLWTRIEGFRREDLCDLLATRRAVRGTMMRGTIHLMSAKDYLKFRGTIQPVLTRGMESILRERAGKLNVEELVEVARDYFDEEPRTFDDLRKFLLERYPDGDERAMGYAVRMHLPLVQVPTDAMWGYPAAARFAVAESWLGKPPRNDEGPGEIVMRYLAAFGPASARDVQTWSGLPGLKEVLEELRPKLRVFRDERGRELFDLPKAPRPSEDTPAPVRFLPDFDNLLLSHEDRKRIMADEHRAAVFLPNLRVLPTFTVDGFVAGTWKIERKKRSATLLITPFGTLRKKERAELAEEGEHLVRFAEPDAETFDIHFP